MNELTPQLAKLIVLKLMKASLIKLQEGAFWKDPTANIPENEQQLLEEACNNHLETLKSNIVFQEKLCK